MNIPFNMVYSPQNEQKYVMDALNSRKHAGNNSYCNRVIELMKTKYGLSEVFLTPSCTSALEMGALLANISFGDEVILPSYTFSSTANSVVIFGAKPKFCEINPDTMNIDVTKIEALITEKTKMIIPIDYAGVPCEMEDIMNIAHKYNLIVMQDAAQSYGSYYKDKASGTIPHLAAFSFHETKNYNAGEGGALVVNVPEWIERAYFLQEKGTDRRLVINGVKSKYSWVDKGSSYLLSDILASVLFAQLEVEDEIIRKRKIITDAYLRLFSEYVFLKKVNIFNPKSYCKLNHHAFWVIFDSEENKKLFISKCLAKQISVYIGYLPLHSSIMGRSFGYKDNDLPITEDLAKRIVRLPFYTSLSEEGLDYCIFNMRAILKDIYK